MGFLFSKPAQEEKVKESFTYTPPEFTEEYEKLLADNTFMPNEHAKYPYFLMQLSEKGEFALGENNDLYVSDAVAAYVHANKVTHIIAQTHGWNTPPDKAISVPFAEFMTGMQNDSAMPKEEDEFKPIFLAFVWPAVPFSAALTEDAMTRTELLIQSEKDVAHDSSVLLAAEAAKKAMEENKPDDADLHEKMATLLKESVDSDDDDDDDDDENDKAIKQGHVEEVVKRARETFAGPMIEGILSLSSPIMRPFENIMFGRLMKRGRMIGRFMGTILAKVMHASENRPKVTMAANSLGAHMLVGALQSAHAMPYKVHAVLFIQGAISRDRFGSGRRYANLIQHVAGPFGCTFSSRDFLLKNVFSPFHGMALGFEGFKSGDVHDMKTLDEMKETPYQFISGGCNSVDGSNFIDEGNQFAGGHGDYKEDETTSLYWSMIKMKVAESAYDRS